MPYADAFVLPVPKKNLDDYRKMAEEAATVWLEHGALEYREWLADDVQPGEDTSFPQAVKLAPDEVVVFAYVLYESRTVRDEVNAKVMKDPRIAHHMETMPFDGKRMFWGGFTPLVAKKA